MQVVISCIKVINCSLNMTINEKLIEGKKIFWLLIITLVVLIKFLNPLCIWTAMQVHVSKLGKLAIFPINHSLFALPSRAFCEVAMQLYVSFAAVHVLSIV